MPDKDKMVDEGCENAKEVASKHGYNLVCDDEEEQPTMLSEDEGCESAKEVAGKHGYSLVCDDDETEQG